MLQFYYDRRLLDSAPETARPMLETMLFVQGGVLKAEQASELAKLWNIELAALPERLLPFAAACALVPVSGFYVGVVVEGGSGNFYLGANMEFAGGFLGLSIHGEQAAVNNAWLNGETAIKALTVNAAPCGHCRQFLHELNCSDTLQVTVVSARSEKHSMVLEDYLPEAFGPADLGIEDGLLSGHAADIDIDTTDELSKMALDAARHSFAPYSGGYAGVALETTTGVRVVGRYAENAAYNPSLQPLASALSQLRFQSLGQGKVQLQRIVMVEKSTEVHHSSHFAALQALFPTIELELLKCA